MKRNWGVRYTDEQKTQIIGRIKNRLSEGAFFKDAIKEAGISDATYYAWTGRTAASRGKSVVSAPAAQGTTSLAEEALQAKKSGVSIKEFAEKRGVTFGAVYRAIRKQKRSTPKVREIQVVQGDNSDKMKLLTWENQKLRNLVAELALDKQALKEHIAFTGGR